MSWVWQKYKDGSRPLSAAVRDYWLNYAYLEGYQWLYWNPGTTTVEERITENDRIQATINRMRANTRTLIANLTQRELVFNVLPTQMDDATLRAARIGEAILRDLHISHDWESLREQHALSVLKGGTAAIAVDWDENEGTSVETPLSIAEFVVEPGTRNAETARWWIKAQVLPPKEVQSIYGGPEPEADATAEMGPFSRKLLGHNIGNSEGSLTPLTLVLTYYERPNPLNPEGQFKVEVNKNIVQEGKWPFPWTDHLNFAMARETLVESQWFGSTILDDVRPIQTAYNAAWSNLLEHMRNAGNARLAANAADAEAIREATDIPGEIMEYTGEKPFYLSPPQLSDWIKNMPSELALAMDDVMGVHDISRGVAGKNAPDSGYGLSILAEKDSSPIGRLIKETARVWGKVATMVLQLHEAEVKTKRTATVNNGIGSERHEWKGSDLLGQTTAIVPLDKVIPRSRAAMQAFADKAMQMGLISNVVQYAKLAELPGPEDVIAAAAPDVAKARRENEAFVMDEVMLPATYDDHAIHIEVHNEFRKTRRYEELSDEQRSVVDDHVQAHETMAAQEAGRAQMQQGVSPALAAAPNADGSAIPQELLAAAQQATPEANEPPMPEAEEVPDPVEMTLDMMQQLGGVEA